MHISSVSPAIALVVTAMLATPLAFAAPSTGSPGMQAALAKAREGSNELRRYVERTKPIYQLDYTEVMLAYEQQQRAVVASRLTTIAKSR
jgi:hypothetical protein